MPLLQDYLATHQANCPKCGYNLYQSTGENCPDCGTKITLTIATSPLSWLYLWTFAFSFYHGCDSLTMLFSKVLYGIQFVELFGFILIPGHVLCLLISLLLLIKRNYFLSNRKALKAVLILNIIMFCVIKGWGLLQLIVFYFEHNFLLDGL